MAIISFIQKFKKKELKLENVYCDIEYTKNFEMPFWVGIIVCLSSDSYGLIRPFLSGPFHFEL